MAVNKTLILEKQAWPLSPATSMTLFCWDLGAISVKKEEWRSWVAQRETRGDRAEADGEGVKAARGKSVPSPRTPAH